MISRIIQTKVNVICRSESGISETYKTIKRSLPFCLFYFRALLGSSCWPRLGLGTTESNNCFLGSKFDEAKKS